MKDFEIIEKNYLYLLKYFDGDVKNLNLDDLKKLKKGIFKGEQVNKIDDEPYCRSRDVCPVVDQNLALLRPWLFCGDFSCKDKKENGLLFTQLWSIL